MTEYFAWGLFGGLIGICAGGLVLRRRGALSVASAAIFPVAVVACLYGAKLQFLMRFLPLPEAICQAALQMMEPGRYFPLGLACALAAALVACWPLRVSGLQMLDALAMAMMVMMPIARVGCLRAGCCTGVECPAWLSPLCLAADPSTHVAELSAGAHVADAHALVPVHPLAIYFALLGIALALACVQLLRRNAPPGALIATVAVLFPLGQLAIEHLRPVSDVRGPMTAAVLVGLVATDLLVVGTWWLIRRRAPVATFHVTGTSTSFVTGTTSAAPAADA